MPVTRTVKEWEEAVDMLETDAEVVSAEGEEPDEEEETRLHDVLDKIEEAIEGKERDSEVTIEDLDETDLR